MTDVNLLFEQIIDEETHIREFNHRLEAMDERTRKLCTIKPTDSRKKMRKKCMVARRAGMHYAPVWSMLMTQPVDIPSAGDGGDGGGGGDGGMSEQHRKELNYATPTADNEKASDVLQRAAPQAWSELGDDTPYQDTLQSFPPQELHRIATQVKSGTVEYPIVTIEDGEDVSILFGGATLALLLRLGYDPQVLVVQLTPIKKKKSEKPRTRTKKKAEPTPKKTQPKKAEKTPPPETPPKKKPEPPKSSTERVRRYYKRHPTKVKKHLRDTQDDRVARNRDRREAVKKYGKKKMKNHDVHHPTDTKSGNWRLARKDHGRDKVNEAYIPMNTGVYEYLLHPQEDLHYTFGDIRELIVMGLGHGINALDEPREMTEGGQYIPIDEKYLAHQNKIKAKYLIELNTLQDNCGMKDSNTLLDYKKAWWNRKLNFDEVPLTESDKELLATRWGVSDKSNRLVNLSSPDAIAWARRVEESLDSFNSKIMYPVHSCIARVMVESVKRGLTLYHAHNPFLAEIAKNKFLTAIAEVQQDDNIDKLYKLNRVMQLIEDTGITTSIPSEGIGMSYNGNVYKYFGPFKPVEKVVEEVVPVEPMTPRIIKKVMTIKERESAKTALKRTIINPETNNLIPLRVALKYDRTHPAYVAAHALLKKGMMNEGIDVREEPTIPTSMVPNEFAQPTADMAIEAAHLGNVSTQIVGSIDKELMHDIDIAVDVEDLKSVVGYDGDDMEELFGSIQEYLADVPYQTFYSPKYGKITIHMPLVDAEGIHQLTHTQQGQSTDVLGMVKVDFMLGNMEWMTSYLVNGSESAYTAIYRNLLIAAIFDVTKFDTEDQQVQSKYEVSTRNGLYKIGFTEDDAGKKTAVSTELVSRDVNAVAHAMFDEEVQFSDIDTFEKLVEALQTRETTLKDFLNVIFIKFRETLDEKGLPHPQEMPMGTADDETGDKTPIAVYPGEFQPFHSGDFHIYSELVKKFGKGNVYIATTDKVASGVAPFNFAQKLDMMINMFDIPKENIFKVKDMFNPIEITGQFPESTPIVFAMTADDIKKATGGNIKSTIEIPTPNMDINGKEVSAEQLRQILGSTKVTDRAKKEIFTKAYKQFDTTLFDKMVKLSAKAEDEKGMTTAYAPPKTTPRTPAVEEPKKLRGPSAEELHGDRELYDMGEVWTAPSGRFGAKNSKGKIAYFTTPEAAQQYSMR